MCFLNFNSIRSRRKAFFNQLKKKIQKSGRRKKKEKAAEVEVFHLKNGGILTVCKDIVAPAGTKITWKWNTGKQEDVRNWLELLPDITLRVFIKLETVDILLTVSQVCSAWRRLSKDPILYRSVVIGGYVPVLRGWNMLDFVKIAKLAAKRSCGKLLKFSCGNMSGFFDRYLLRMLVPSSKSLKSLRLGFCQDYTDFEEMVQIVQQLPSLEDLYLHYCYFPPGILEEMGSFIPKLKYLQIGVVYHYADADDRALEIAKGMPNLRRLRLHADLLTNKGLQVIVDGCTHLEYVYLKGFSNLEGELLKKHCPRIKSIELLTKSDKFGVEYELYLKVATIDGGLIDAKEEHGDYGVLSLYNSPFKDYCAM